MIDDLFVGYSTPHALCSTPIADHSNDDIQAPSYSPISFLCTPHRSLCNGDTQPSNIEGCTKSPNVSGDHNKSDWRGFIIVGDNIDKTIHARHETLDSRNRSLHYFNSYAVLDRCDFSSFSEHHSPPDLVAYDVRCLLPTTTDLDAMIQNFSILVGRLLTKYVPGFAAFKSLSIPHIQHKHSVEMSKKSEVVSSAYLKLNFTELFQFLGYSWDKMKIK